MPSGQVIQMAIELWKFFQICQENICIAGRPALKHENSADRAYKQTYVHLE